MKLKTFSKKLALNKRTIAHLDIKKMKELNGGALPPYTPLPICCTLGSSEYLCCPTHKP